MMHLLRRRSRFEGRESFVGERGQMIVMVAISMTAMIAFAALAIDVGFLTHDRRDLQNGADAMALSGGSQIKPDGAADSLAQTEALKWAGKNKVSPGEVESITFGLTCSGDLVPNTITVRLERTNPTFLARVIGIDSGTVGVCATAARYSPGGSVGAAPFLVEDNCIFGPDGDPNTGDANEMGPGDTITLKYDSNNPDGVPCGANTGNFWTAAIDESGSGEPCGTPEPASDAARKLKEAICWGAITPLCVPEAVSQGEDCETTVDTQTGNQVGGIRESLKYVADNAPDDCDTMGEITDEVEVEGILVPVVVDDCNPFLGDDDELSLVMLIPVVDGLFPDANGHSTVDIVNFLVVVIYPEQTADNNWCKGNKCDVTAMIVDTSFNPEAFRRELDEDSSGNFTVLID